ncbi:hypothetical protein GE21DRAFT_1201329 [Neurospora crassa]|nr:hypothetical protein B14D6.50 [imported] - Neurospora crassa [Neurospora crassa]KHE87604.1 hypothetical protein GE21DRAFT_1201329 [Neurospora crassa]
MRRRNRLHGYLLTQSSSRQRDGEMIKGHPRLLLFPFQQQLPLHITYVYLHARDVVRYSQPQPASVGCEALHNTAHLLRLGRCCITSDEPCSWLSSWTPFSWES